LWDQVCNPKAPSYGFINVAVDGSKNSSTGGALSDQGVSTEDSSPDAGVLCEVRSLEKCFASLIYIVSKIF
jgi:hypothetical protein